jgi:hypothetical protein
MKGKQKGAGAEGRMRSLQKDFKAAVILRLVKGQHQHTRTILENRKVLRFASRTDQQTVDDVQTGKIADSRRHYFQRKSRQSWNHQLQLESAQVLAGVGLSG